MRGVRLTRVVVVPFWSADEYEDMSPFVIEMGFEFVAWKEDGGWLYSESRLCGRELSRSRSM